MRQKVKVVLILFLILLLQFTLRSTFFSEPFERDEGGLGYVAQRILAGELPYRDVFDHKPPVTYYIYAAVIKVLGSSLFSIRLFTAIYSLFITLAIFGIGYLIFGSTGGLVAAFLYALFSGGPLIQGASANTETFMVLPMLMALFFFLHRNFFLAGLFSGLAVMIKPVAVFNFIALLLFTPHPYNPLSILWRGDTATKQEVDSPLHKVERGAGVRMALGFLVFPAVFTLYFAAHGALADFLFCVWTANRYYVKVSSAFAPLYGLAKIWGQIRFENGVLWLLSVLALLMIFFKDRKKDFLLLVAWAVLSFIGVSTASAFFYGHYFIQLIPSLCLLATYALIKTAEIKNLYPKMILSVVLAAILLSNLNFQYPFYFKYNPFQVTEKKYGMRIFGVAYWVSAELAGQLAKDDDIFVWSAEPEVYFYLNKKAPGKYSYYLAWMQGLIEPEAILKDVQEKKPRYIIWTNYLFPFPQLEKWVIENYNLKQVYLEWRLLERKK